MLKLCYVSAKEKLQEKDKGRQEGNGKGIR